ncbi:MAG TPA: hypothetical protein VII56_01910 [Rhizomicrobium sp.]
MTDSKRAFRCAAIALSLTSAIFGTAKAATSEGGYNTMGNEIAYYDNGHDRANAAAMLVGLNNSANFYRDGYWDKSHHWHYNHGQSAIGRDRDSGGSHSLQHR